MPADPPTHPNIVSFLPAATEMVYALGLGERLVGISHECDFPLEVRSKPVVVRCALDLTGLTAQQIDRQVSEQLERSGSLYTVDENLLRRLAPGLILTQNLCQVCAPSGNEASRAVAMLRPPPEVLWMSPHSLSEVLGNLRDLGRATDQEVVANRAVHELEARLDGVRSETTPRAERTRVFCMEWADPIYCSGHWVPEMVHAAGGIDGMGLPGRDSRRIPWEDVRRWAPEVVVFSPCGFHLDAAVRAAGHLASLPGWRELPAVRNGRVYAVDSSSYFSRPGPRLVYGVELLAHLIDPERFDWRGPPDAYRSVDLP